MLKKAIKGKSLGCTTEAFSAQLLLPKIHFWKSHKDNNNVNVENLHVSFFSCIYISAVVIFILSYTHLLCSAGA